MVRVLKMVRHDERTEIEFELGFLASLSIEQRVALVLERSRLLREMLENHGHTLAPGHSKRA